jgi:hypothetical protein
MDLAVRRSTRHDLDYLPVDQFKQPISVFVSVDELLERFECDFLSRNHALTSLCHTQTMLTRMPGNAYFQAHRLSNSDDYTTAFGGIALAWVGSPASQKWSRMPSKMTTFRPCSGLCCFLHRFRLL